MPALICTTHDTLNVLWLAYREAVNPARAGTTVTDLDCNVTIALHKKMGNGFEAVRKTPEVGMFSLFRTSIDTDQDMVTSTEQRTHAFLERQQFPGIVWAWWPTLVVEPC